MSEPEIRSWNLLKQDLCLYLVSIMQDLNLELVDIWYGQKYKV